MENGVWGVARSWIITFASSWERVTGKWPIDNSAIMNNNVCCIVGAVTGKWRVEGCAVMDNNVCFIVGAGDYYGLDFLPDPGDYVIGADGGLTYLERSGLTANLVIGDFDSLKQRPEHPHVITLNKEKDDTDTFAAVREGISLGYRVFHLYCCTGGRLDHTIANIQLLAYLAENSMKGFLFDKDSITTAVTDGSIRFNPCSGGYISVFSYSEKSSGVCVKGLKYTLDDADLSNIFPLGVSNEFIGGESVLSVRKGTIIVVFPREAKISTPR